MILLAFYQWWYGPGWLEWWRRSLRRIRRTYDYLSVDVLLRTLFAPWRRITSPPGRSVSDKFRAFIDNTVSRFVGLGVRLLVLLTAVILLSGQFLVGVAGSVLWPLAPILVPACIILGIIL